MQADTRGCSTGLRKNEGKDMERGGRGIEVR